MTNVMSYICHNIQEEVITTETVPANYVILRDQVPFKFQTMTCHQQIWRDALIHWRRDKMAAIFLDDIFKCIFLNEKFCILVKISLKFVPKGPIDNNPALVYIMDWRRICDKPLSEPMLILFYWHIYLTLRGGGELTATWRHCKCVELMIKYWGMDILCY